MSGSISAKNSPSSRWSIATSRATPCASRSSHATSTSVIRSGMRRCKASIIAIWSGGQPLATKRKRAREFAI